MNKNLQGYALPLALILVAIFSIFVANISVNSDSGIQNYIKNKYHNSNVSLQPINLNQFIFQNQTYTFDPNSHSWK
jgi:hypothetical protein